VRGVYCDCRRSTYFNQWKQVQNDQCPGFLNFKLIADPLPTPPRQQWIDLLDLDPDHTLQVLNAGVLQHARQATRAHALRRARNEFYRP
jgi:hypothetical protein